MDLQSHLALLQVNSSFENVWPLVHCASTMIVQREAELQCGGNTFASISKQLACLITKWKIPVWQPLSNQVMVVSAHHLGCVVLGNKYSHFISIHLEV